MDTALATINSVLSAIDDAIWGVPLIVLILAGGILLSFRLKGIQIRQLPRALRYMIKNEEGGSGEVTSFGALCTALSATIGTGNIVGVATAVVAGGPGALFWMFIAALFGMATKYSEGLLAVKYREVDKNGHSLGGPFYYIEKGMGHKAIAEGRKSPWRWLAKLFAFFGCCVGLFGIGTFTQVNSINSASNTLFATLFGTKDRSSAAARTFARVDSETSRRSLSALDAVDTDTPALRATSVSVITWLRRKASSTLFDDTDAPLTGIRATTFLNSTDTTAEVDTRPRFPS